MRLWSIHPKYLDSKGLVALWREALLGRKVLKGETTGYKHHPQLDRFRRAEYPIRFINQYLYFVYLESLLRDYDFNRKKLPSSIWSRKYSVNSKQVKYEFELLQSKLVTRDIDQYTLNRKDGYDSKSIKVMSCFKTIPGEIESWECPRIC